MQTHMGPESLFLEHYPNEEKKPTTETMSLKGASLLKTCCILGALSRKIFIIVRIF